VERSPPRKPSTKTSLRVFLIFQQIEPQSVGWALLGAAVAGVVGAFVGLIIGLFVHAPTAPFAIVEIGLPAAMVGGVLGLLIGSVKAIGRRISR